jgi:hypothetical protein
MGVFLVPLDLPSGTGDALGLTVDQMIEDAEGLALLAAPCLGTTPSTLTPVQLAAVKAVLRGAIMRWNDVGSGARQSITTGPFSESIDTTVARRGMYWPSEITSLQSICSDGESGKAFGVDTVSFAGVHADICSINFGAPYCSCGADIAGYPLWEV